MFVVRKKLSADEGAPPNTRYNPDTDTFETSVDGGTTWTENPGADPRVNPAYQMPPNTAPDVRCAAAAGMVEDVRRVIDAAITGGGVVGIGNILIAFLILPLGWVYLLIVAVAAALAGVTSFAWNAAFTEETYEGLLCLFFDQLDADGHIDQAGWDALLAQAYIDFADPNVGGGLELVFKLHGVIGLNNAGSAYADPEADCSVCVPPGTCYEIEWLTEPNPEFTTIFAGSWGDGYFEQVCSDGVGSTSTMNIGQTISGNGSPCHYDRVEVDVLVIGLPTSVSLYGANVFDPDTSDLDFLGTVGASVGLQTVGVDVDGSAYYGVRMIIDTDTGCGAGDVNLYKVRICSPDLAAAALEANCESCPE